MEMCFGEKFSHIALYSKVKKYPCTHAPDIEHRLFQSGSDHQDGCGAGLRRQGVSWGARTQPRKGVESRWDGKMDKNQIVVQVSWWGAEEGAVTD